MGSKNKSFEGVHENKTGYNSKGIYINKKKKKIVGETSPSARHPKGI